MWWGAEEEAGKRGSRGALSCRRSACGSPQEAPGRRPLVVFKMRAELGQRLASPTGGLYSLDELCHPFVGLTESVDPTSAVAISPERALDVVSDSDLGVSDVDDLAG